jgi:hypothetical protein
MDKREIPFRRAWITGVVDFSEEICMSAHYGRKISIEEILRGCEDRCKKQVATCNIWKSDSQICR